MAANVVVGAPLEHQQWSTKPPAPAAGTIEVYAKTDEHLWIQTPAGAEKQVIASYATLTKYGTD